MLANNSIVATDMTRTLELHLSEEEAYEVLLRCVSHEDEDNIVFQSAIQKLADAIKNDCRLAA